MGGRVDWVSSQLVPKSTCTEVNLYPFLVNSYLTFGQLVPYFIFDSILDSFKRFFYSGTR